MICIRSFVFVRFCIYILKYPANPVKNHTFIIFYIIYMLTIRSCLICGTGDRKARSIWGHLVAHFWKSRSTLFFPPRYRFSSKQNWATWIEITAARSGMASANHTRRAWVCWTLLDSVLVSKKCCAVDNMLTEFAPLEQFLRPTHLDATSGPIRDGTFSMADENKISFRFYVPPKEADVTRNAIPCLFIFYRY